MNRPQLIIKAIKERLIPLTEKEVAAGNHVFGGLVMEKESGRVITAGSNNRQANPIYHGEIDTIQRFFAAKDHPAPAACLFVASHDPCPMCASAISWAGFPEIWVLFSYEDVKKEFGMPVDLMMYKEIFGAEGARSENAFFKKYDLKKEAAKEENAAELLKEIAEIEALYGKMQVQDFDYPGMQ
ncbi:MAG: deaminase [bacterium]|nr:deaminase [bacterium]